MKNNIYNVDFLLQKALRSSETPDAGLVQKTKQQYKFIKEEHILEKKSLRRSLSAVAAVAAAVLLITTTAFAAWYFLNPSDVAEKVGDRALSAAFTGEDAININASATSGDYIFTLLAVVSGSDLTDMPYYSNGDLRDDRTYTVLAIERADGAPIDNRSEDTTMSSNVGLGEGSVVHAELDETGEMNLSPTFFASPLVKGEKPWEVNVITMNGAYYETVVDGVLYRVVECDNIMMFADRGLYFGVATGVFCNNQTFAFDERTGEISVNPAFDGASAVFDLPIDASAADPAKAAQYLESLNAPAENDAAPEKPSRPDDETDAAQAPADVSASTDAETDAGSGETRFVLTEG
jgi:hypothetical protein